MITVYQNAVACIIRPTPLVSISQTTNRNKDGVVGSSYDITLTGAILADEGSPYWSNGAGGFANNYTRPTSEIVDFANLERLSAILYKQNKLRELFAKDGQLMEISPINEPAIRCYPNLVSVNFEEGTYTDLCRYTIILRADTLLDVNDKVLAEGGFTTIDGSKRLTELEMILKHGGLVDEYSEDWSFEVDDSNGLTNDISNRHNPRTYRLTRTVSATGKTKVIPSGITTVSIFGWEQAKGFVVKTLLRDPDGANAYPNFQNSIIAKDAINISQAYGGYNHARSENLNKTAGTYSVTDTWLLSSGTAYENYNININSSIDNAFVSVSIDGTIRGLSTIPVSGDFYGGIQNTNTYNTPYDNALIKFNNITNNGQYGLTSNIYKRANNAVAPTLNSQPKSIAIGSNQFTGEITYNLEFDNRPVNIISGVLSETINVNDTYPGDVFAVIPVLGRKTGPVLQYLGTRTEYRRDVGIEILLDYTDVPYGSGRNPLLLTKPSLNEPIKTQLNNLIKQLSPAYEPGVRKYFLSPPAESWNPKEGRYSINLSWTYELDQ